MTAKKDKKARRLARKRKLQCPSQTSGQQVLLKRAQSSEHLKNAQVLVNPPQTEKMSDVILRFAKPLLQGDASTADKNVIRFAILIWNASLLPQAEQRESVKIFIEKMPDADGNTQRAFLAMIEALFERKKQSFANNRRFIFDYQISTSQGYLHLDVVSSLDQDKKESGV